MRLDLAPRLDTPPTFRVYVEIMASRSNVILVAVDQPSGVETIAACAYQVSPNKSVRPLSTGEKSESKHALKIRLVMPSPHAEPGTRKGTQLFLSERAGCRYVAVWVNGVGGARGTGKAAESEPVGPTAFRPISFLPQTPTASSCSAARPSMLRVRHPC